MRYRYNMFGWFIAGDLREDKRFTIVPPVNKSVSVTPGHLRSNWTGRQWVEIPYTHVDEDAYLAEVAASRPIQVGRPNVSLLASEVVALKIRVAKLEGV